MTVEQVLQARVLEDPITRLQAPPPHDNVIVKLPLTAQHYKNVVMSIIITPYNNLIVTLMSWDPSSMQ